jgi:twinkle protein
VTEDKFILASHAKTAVLDLHRDGLPKGDSTGWISVDKLYTVLPGMLTVVTGWPGSGKSEWVDAMCMNLAESGWRFLMASFENRPVHFHISKLLEKHVRRPFGHGPTERMTEEHITDAMAFIDKHFAFLHYERAMKIDDVLEAALQFASTSEGQYGLVIDPWNELEHGRPPSQTETEYISHCLREIRLFARNWGIHVWVVAHPQKLPRDQSGKLPIPRPDSISGSQHWWNKADYAITVYRDPTDESQNVDIHVQKVRWKHTGQVGVTTLKWDRITGRYHEALQVVGGKTKAAGDWVDL